MTIEEAEKAVEEARARLVVELTVAPGSSAYWEALDALIETVRQAERERAQGQIQVQAETIRAYQAWSRRADALTKAISDAVRNYDETARRGYSARSSEEAGNG